MRFAYKGLTALSFVLAAAMLIPGSSHVAMAQEQAFDGKWKFRLKSDSNNPANCPGGLTTGTVKVDQGRVKGSLNHPLTGAFQAKGTVDGDGTIAVSAQGLDTIDAEGTFKGETGEGSWRTLALSCHGTWTAEKK